MKRIVLLASLVTLGIVAACGGGGGGSAPPASKAVVTAYLQCQRPMSSNSTVFSVDSRFVLPREVDVLLDTNGDFDSSQIRDTPFPLSSASLLQDRTVTMSLVQKSPPYKNISSSAVGKGKRFATFVFPLHSTGVAVRTQIAPDPTPDVFKKRYGNVDYLTGCTVNYDLTYE